MKNMTRNIRASNASARAEIVRSAMYSYCGRIMYRKWNGGERKYEPVTHVVVPIDAKVFRRKDGVERNFLYVVDIEEHNQVKSLIVEQIMNFKCRNEKVKVAWDIQLDNIRNVLGVPKNAIDEEHGMAAGRRGARELVARELSRIAQEIYEFSGCEGHLYSRNKRKDPNSYEVVGKEGRIARRLMAYLTESQRRLTEHFTRQRRKDMSFGEYFKWDSDGRCFIPLNYGGKVQELSKMDDDASQEIYSILKSEGYVCPDYTTGYCYLETDRDFSAKNPPRLLTVLKKALRNDKATYERLRKSFNERSSGSMKRKGEVKLSMCITHNPEDVAGMSTNRDWTSCMRLPSSPEEVSRTDLKDFAPDKEIRDMYVEYYGLFGHQKMGIDEIAKKHGRKESEVRSVIEHIDFQVRSGGEYYPTALKQVKYGGMVAYLVAEDDTSIRKPYARIAIKRFENESGGFIFVQEGTVYGDEYISDACGFEKALKKELDASNKTTGKEGSEYVRTDGMSWSDSQPYHQNGKTTVEAMEKMPWMDVYRVMRDENPKLTSADLSKIIRSHRDKPPKGIVDVFVRHCGFIDDDFVESHADLVDVDLYNLEHGYDLVPMARYEGNDAPRSEEEMVNFVIDAMEMERPSDDYGDMGDGDEPRFRGSANPYAIYSMAMDDVPDIVRNYCSNTVNSGLKTYYDSKDDDDFRREYPTFALFEEDFHNGLIEDEMILDEVYMGMTDAFSWEDYVDYEIGVCVDDVSDGYEDKDSVFTLTGSLRYSVPRAYGRRITSVEAYGNMAVINTEDEGWKAKLTGFVQDLYRQLPVLM